MKTFTSIQYLRALAAIAVAAYHARQWLGGGFEVGRAGVDLFFVISGFIMWTITAGAADADGSAQPGRFLWRRVTRVVPAYWVATLGMAALALTAPDFVPQIRAGWRHVLLSMAFIPHLDPLGQPFPMLPAGWTLNYEAVFYLLFAAGLFLGERFRLLVVTAALVGIGVVGYFHPVAYGLGANFMMAEFAAGLWIGRLVQLKALPPASVGAVLVALALTTFAATDGAAFSDSFLRPLWWGVPSAMLVVGVLALEAAGRVPEAPPVRALGDASYAIYLVHTAVIAAVVHTLGTGSPALFTAAAIAAAVAAGWLFHRAAERPLIGLVRRLAPAAAPH